ncbi:unnamed protein product, partial [Mesorhabditis spiculigera]
MGWLSIVISLWLLHLAFGLSFEVLPQCREAVKYSYGQVSGSEYYGYEIPIDLKLSTTDTSLNICADLVMRHSGYGMRRTKTGTKVGRRHRRLAERAVINTQGRLPNATVEYLAQFPWKGIQINDEYDDDNTGLWDALTRLLEMVPTIEELYLLGTNQKLDAKQTAFLDVLANRTWKIISNEGFPWPKTLDFKTTQLKAVRIFDTKLKVVPTWIKSAKGLQYLQIDNGGTELGELGTIADLPVLEHLILTRCGMTSVNNSLVTSPKLISLDLTCNTITEIPDGFFDAMPGVQFLSLLGNPITSFTQRLMKPLTNLKHLDIGRQTLYSGSKLGANFYLNRVGRRVLCTTYKASEPKLSSFPPDLLPNPSKLVSLEIVGQDQIQLAPDYFAGFPSLQMLNLHGVNLSTMVGLGLEKIAGLNYVRASALPFKTVDWFPEEVITNLNNLQHLFLQDSNVVELNAPLVALAKTSPFFCGELKYDIDSYRMTKLSTCALSILGQVLSAEGVSPNCTQSADTLISEAKQLIATKFE